MCVSEHPREALEEMNKYFPIKPISIEPPKICLGEKREDTVTERGRGMGNEHESVHQGSSEER